MSVKSHVHRLPSASERSTRVKRTRAEPEGARVAASLDSWLSKDWSQAIHVESLEALQQIHVCTQNTLYELILINHSGEVRVRGGRFFPDWTPARFAGSTAGGSFLKRLAFSLGLQMEFELECRRIITSPVRTIAILQKSMMA
jgi:hypothetical protein